MPGGAVSRTKIDKQNYLAIIARMNKTLTGFFYAGLFLLSFSLLACQILLTRILSLLFSCHFVFLVISVVMFGLTLGSLLVYRNKGHYDPQKSFDTISRYSFYSAASLLLNYLSLFYLPSFLIHKGLTSESVIYIYVPLLAAGFVFFGVVISLLLTLYPEKIGRVYAVNLLGSAAGCIGAYFILNNFNGFSAACVLVILCLLASLLFSFNTKDRRQVLFYEFSLLLVIFAGCFNQSRDAVQPMWAKEMFFTTPPLYSKWNFFSYVSVIQPAHTPFGWGYSPKVRDIPIRTREAMILIDEGAGTALTKFKDISDLNYLKYDISNLPYHIRHYDSVYVIGVGGGRDLLAARLFGAGKIVGVELNKDIMDITTGKTFGFAGNLKNFPQIEMHNDDGRAFIARSHARYDLIQSSLVDTFSASAMGSFALSENNLYTKEAWIIYLRHLSDKGVLTFSRWYMDDSREIYRLLSLAQSALNEAGIKGNIRDHVVLARTKASDFVDLTAAVPRSKFLGMTSIKGTIADPDNKNGIWEDVSPTAVHLKARRSFKAGDLNKIAPEDISKMYSLVQSSENIGTILVSKAPFSAAELDALEKVCRDMDFQVMLDGRKSEDGNFDRILNGDYRLSNNRADVSPTTDDRPFYFYFSNLRSFFSARPIGPGAEVLRQTSGIIVILGVLFILFPFVFTPQKSGYGRIELWPGVYFTAIGLGFMFLEIPLIQRLGLFLGHPVYGLTVVLFSLLLACGAGSYAASRTSMGRILSVSFPSLLFLILVLAFGLPALLWQATEQIIPVKVFLSGVCVFVVGLFLGMFFPTGVSVVSRDRQAPLIFYWAINGFASMCAAAFAMIFLINLGYRATLMFAFLFYLTAFYALTRIARSGTVPVRRLVP
jgi:hypothetical protein